MLSIDGISEFQEDSWNGISYENLVYAVNNFIPSYKIDIQNKWFTFAKEFLNHLTNYYLKPLNMDNFNFIKDNASEIQKLFQITFVSKGSTSTKKQDYITTVIGIIRLMQDGL